MSSHNDGSNSAGAGAGVGAGVGVGSGVGSQPEAALSDTNATPLTAVSPTKRVALAGQWRTPPLPVFGAGTGGMKQQHQHQHQQQQQQQHQQQQRQAEQGGEAQQLASSMPAAQGQFSHVTQGQSPSQVTTTQLPEDDGGHGHGHGHGLVHQTNHHQTQTNETAQANQLPGSAEDYAKALQEAYRRGAQAAAAMAAAAAAAALQGPSLPQAASMPNLQVPVSAPPVSVPAPAPVSVPNPTLKQEYSYEQQHSHAPVGLGVGLGLGLAAGEVSGDDFIAPILPPPLSQMSSSPNSRSVPNPLELMDPDNHSHSNNHNHNHNHNMMSTMEDEMDDNGKIMPPPPSQPHQQPRQGPLHPSQQQNQNQSSQSHTHTQSHQQRSISLPDMTTYAAAQEAEKRAKRLARNRASARLRRLRKKNLVDAYETEVGILEKTLQQLQAHEWGAQDNASALTEALSMDRGQQVLDRASRQQAAHDILEQQLQLMDQLQDMMHEQYLLQQLASNNSSEFDDLKEALQLSDEQVQQLSAQQSGWAEEWAALQTVKASLQAMKENDWLSNEGCSNAAEAFLAILHKNQVSKFLLWADHNAEAIDELDSVNAANDVPAGPVFGFGVESNVDGGLMGED